MDARARAASLAIWRGPVEPVPVGGGITNANFLVEDAGRRCFVRIGGDIPAHHILRWNELAASRAAHAAGISPAVLHAEPGVLVLELVEGRTLGPADVRERRQLERIVPLLRRVHRELPRHLRGPTLAFWVFHVVRDYAAGLREAGHRLSGQLSGLLARAERLEAAVGPIELVFGHNDLLAANLIDDGARLWLVDWDYGGWNSPLFDLGGLASNSELPDADRDWLLEAYYGRPSTTPCAAVPPPCSRPRCCARRCGAWSPRSTRRSTSTSSPTRAKISRASSGRGQAI
ncbi:MAG: choline/ethanolamine kinase family protein [Geminicoccaceae bacterium]